MTEPTYTTAAKVAGLVNMTSSGARLVFSTSTVPTESEVNDIILRAEDRIDNAIGHAWREVTVSNEKHSIENKYNYGTGICIYLNHRKIKTFDSDEGDSLKVWNGSEWEEWLDNKTESRSDDFWVDYEQGKIFIRSGYPSIRMFAVDVTYRYGDTTVPGDIEDVATKMVAMELIRGSDKTVEISDGTRSMSFDSRVSGWKREINEVISRRAEFQIPAS